MGISPILAAPMARLLLAGSAPRTNGGLQPQLGRGSSPPGGGALGPAPGDGIAEALQLGWAVGAVDPWHPVGGPGHPQAGLDRPLLWMAPRPQAGPGPLFRPFSQLGAQRVALHIPADGQQVRVGLKGKRLLRPVVEMAGSDALPRHMPPSRVGRGDAPHELAQLALRSGPEHEGPVVGHQPGGHQSHGHVRQRVGPHP